MTNAYRPLQEFRKEISCKTPIWKTENRWRNNTEIGIRETDCGDRRQIKEVQRCIKYNVSVSVCLTFGVWYQSLTHWARNKIYIKIKDFECQFCFHTTVYQHKKSKYVDLCCRWYQNPILKHDGKYLAGKLPTVALIHKIYITENSSL